MFYLEYTSFFNPWFAWVWRVFCRAGERWSVVLTVPAVVFLLHPVQGTSMHRELETVKKPAAPQTFREVRSQEFPAGPGPGHAFLHVPFCLA